MQPHHCNRRHQGATLRRLFAAGTFCLLAACGGGGSDGGSTPLVLPGFTGEASGRVSLVTLQRGTLLESEPNDSVALAQPLGRFSPGQQVRLLGRLDADAGDTTDGFAFDAGTFSEVRVDFSYADSAGLDLSLGLYDPVAMQFVREFPLDQNPGFFRFHARGPFQLVVTAASGATNFDCFVRFLAPSNPLTEIEPNDATEEAEYLGGLPVGESITLNGNADANLDPIDRIRITVPVQADITVELVQPAFADFDLVLGDATTTPDTPQPIVTFDTNPVAGTQLVAGGTLLELRIEANQAVGPWRLEVSAAAPASSKPTLQVATVRAPAPLSLEADRHDGRAPAYGALVGPCVPGEILFCVSDPAEIDGLCATYGLGIEGEIPGVACCARTDVPPGLSDEEAARATYARSAALRCARCVQYAEPNYIRMPLTTQPDDPFYGLQWHYDLINLERAWDITTGSPNTIVAVIDTGSIDHVDLNNRQVGGYDFVSDTTNAADGDGIDSDPTDPGAGVGAYHGGHVAGTIGADSNNGVGVAGVTWAGQLMQIRVLGQFGGTDFDIANGIRYAARLSNSSGTLPANRAHVINMSLGGPQAGQTLLDACDAAEAAGVVIFAASGNENSSTASFPAGYTSTISIGAVTLTKQRAPYSNYGSTLDLVAPGGDTSQDANADGWADGVLSTYLYGNPPSDSYVFLNGTSMASPHAAGVAALLFALDPNLTPSQVRNILVNTAEDLGSPGRDNIYGYGLIDAFAALQSINPNPIPTPVPVLQLTPEVLNFGAARFTYPLEVRNIGAGLLDITDVQVETFSGGAWLSATAAGNADATRSHSRIDVSVSRTGLLPGSYGGIVTIVSNGGTIEVPVVMEIQLAALPPPDLPITIEAIRVDTGEVAQRQVVNPVSGLSFFFASLPEGDYIFRAGSDLDRDGEICEEGDYCGAFPVEGDPTTVTVRRSLPVNNLNFLVSDSTALGVSGR